ncbi:MAG: flagellar biosynthesis protein FlhA [Candidatus Gastranaerophilales bacterium]|nr:flagellar biosynthesis protein FlhA [Candidatus Gastranaerophilales bacterium]
MDFNKLAKMIQNNDVALAIGMVLVVAMMVIPLPAPVLDILLVINISLSVIILLVCMYVQEPLEYSSFPTMLLMSTLFRLALNISSTRLILLHADAGNVIEAFGNVAVGGNYVVGTVVFIILVIINFMVITGGATRVAEVSARFTLDSMPGKQLSIDSDLNAGLITEDQARTRRRKLEREANFYGTMDGASKFVKGDAGAGIVITIVNIVGGLIIGIWQQSMDFMVALSTFTILTVGDGLVSQLPALFISTATGMIVSRAAGQDTSLSTDVNREMFSDPRILFIVAGLLCLIGFVPGFPPIPFLSFAAGLGFFAYNKQKEKQTEKEKEAQQILAKEQEAKKPQNARKKASREDVMELLNVEAMEIEIGYRLVSLLDAERNGDLLDRISQIRRQTALDLGIILPSIRVRDNLQLAPNAYQIKLKGVAIESGEVYPEKLLAMNSADMAETVGLRGINAIEPAFGLPALWISDSDRELAELNGFTVVTPSAVISTHLTEVIKKNSAEILTRADVKSLVENLKKDNEEVIDQLMKDISYSEVQVVMQNLLKERVSVRDLQTILETIGTYSKINKESDYLTEQCRMALSRSICKQNMTDAGDLLAVTLSPDIENVIAAGMSANGQSLSLDPNFTRMMIDNLNQEIEKALTQTGNQPVILCSSPIRLAFRRLIERTYPQISVLSYNEIPPNVSARSVGVVRAHAMS